ncbi:MAG: hypothetical protein ABIS46_00530 [Sphingomicrobium sp.]
MGDSSVAAAFDRLPWLEDELQQSPEPALPPLWRWSFPAFLIISLGSYWLGLQS